MSNRFWITDSRFKIILIVLFVMWLGVMALFYLKANEVTKDPCSICAERMGENVICSPMDSTPLKKIFFPNYSIEVSPRG